MAFSLYNVACDCIRKNDHRYKRIHCQLTEVPSDIPATIKEVQLDENNIASIIDGTFSRFGQCTELSLSNNKLRSIRQGMFIGLKFLDTLDLSGNIISSIESGSFIDLYHLTTVNLDHNRLTTLKNPFSEPSSGSILFYLSNNPLQCNNSLCWLKNAERDGRINLSKHKPTCVDNRSVIVNWDDVVLDCSLGEFSLLFTPSAYEGRQ